MVRNILWMSLFFTIFYYDLITLTNQIIIGKL